MIKTRFSTALTVITLSLAASSARADSLIVQWNSGPGADGNYYQRIDEHSATPLTYAQAAAEASAKEILVGGTTVLTGQLAVLNPDYADAFTFIRSNVMYPQVNPAPDNEIYWVGASSPTGNQPPNDANNSDWTWINGSPVPDSVASGWNIDHFEGPGPEGIGYYQSGSGTLWDYTATASSNLAYGYVVEFPVPEPSIVLLALPVFLAARRRPRAA